MFWLPFVAIRLYPFALIVFLVKVFMVKEHFAFEMERTDEHFQGFLFIYFFFFSVVADRKKRHAWKANP